MVGKLSSSLLLEVVLFSPLWTGTSSPNSTFKIILTDNPSTRSPIGQFSCHSNKVYALLLVPNKVIGKHLLEGYWYKPDGRLQEHTQVALNFDKIGEDTVYLWLQFDIETKGIYGKVLPDFGDEIFDGDWRVEVLWDKQNIFSSTFTVRCL